MPVFGRAGSIPSGVPQFLTPPRAPDSLTGDNTAQVATSQTTVCFPRTTFYQAVAAPVFVPIVMGWFSALGTPTAKAALTAAVLASGGVLPPTQTAVVETVTVDKWFQNLNGPPRPGYTVSNSDAGFPAVDAVAVTETVSVDRWLRPLDVPQRPRPVADQLDTVLGVPPITIEWLRQLDVPQKPRTVAAQQALAYVGFPPFANGTSDEWFRPLDEPTRSIPRPRPEWTFTYNPVVAGEDVTIDKWYRGLDLPQAKRYAPSHIALGYIGADPFPEVVSIDRWLRPLELPTRAKPRLEGIFVHPPQEAGDKRWYVPLSEPVRVRQTVVWQQFFAADTTTPAAAPVPTVDSYYKWLSEPVRLSTLAPAQQVAATIDPVALTLPSPPRPTSRQKDGDPDYWKLPWFNVEGESFADKLRAKTLIALEEVISEPTEAKSVAPAVAKTVRKYARIANPLLSDTDAAELGELSRQLGRSVKQKNVEAFQQAARDTRALLIAHLLQQRDEEEALIALGMY